MNGSTSVVAGPRQISTTVDGDVVVLDLHDGVYYGLEGVAARVWELVQQPRTLGEIRDELLREYAVDAERCEGDLVRLVGDLAARGLVEVA